MRFLYFALTATMLLLYENIAFAQEWRTPEALRAFGQPGDTVNDPALTEEQKPSSTKINKNNRQDSAEIRIKSNLISSDIPLVTKSTDESLESFKAELIEVYNHPNPEQIRTLVYPKSLACMRSEAKYEKYLMRAETIQAIPSDAVVSIEKRSANAALPYRGFNFPLPPSHIVRMEFGKKVLHDGSKTSQIAEKYIARANGRWYLIFPCPTSEGMGRLREMGLLE